MNKKFLSGILICFAALVASPGFAVTWNGQALVGLRSAAFKAAPETQSMYLYDMGAVATMDPFTSVPVNFGITANYQNMRGGIQPGLTEFSGYTAGPQIGTKYRFGDLTPFARVSYVFGRFSGKGKESWDGDDNASFFAFREEATTEVNKTYSTVGTHFAMGLTWDVMPNIAALGQLDWGFERMTSNSRVIYRGTEKSRTNTAFDSSSLQFGAQMSL